jgi:hypothetical protein
MQLKDLMVNSKSVWLKFPALEGFEVEVAIISRKELSNLRKACTVQRFDRKTRTTMEELDESKFVSRFAKATVKNWKGLKLKYLETLILIDTDGRDLEEELDYSEENAEALVANSTEFDTWLNECVFDLDNFRS